MNILIVGRGWVGNKMYHELIARGHNVSICEHTLVESTLSSGNYDWVVNCAGVTGNPNVDACELDKVNTILGNAYYPIELESICKQYKVRLSHFSSGCIYEGNIEDVDALPNFFGSTYSISKGISDVALRDKAQVYRIRMPFSKDFHPKNYLVKVIKYAKTGKLFEGGHNSLTNIDEAVSVACNLIERNEPNGVYNLVNKGSITMHELVELLKLSPEWFTPEEFQSITKCRRSNCTIPAHNEMKDVITSLKYSIEELDKQM